MMVLMSGNGVASGGNASDELISNASDALDKIRFESLTGKSKLDAQPEFFIMIVPDITNNTMSIIDSGVGMTKADAENSWYEEIWAPEVNDFVSISDKAYSNDQILKMEKVILGQLEWYITVPTPYVFLTRYIKASIPDPEMEHLVYFLAELAMMNYGCCTSASPYMVAASAVFVARHTLNKTPVWTETLKRHTGFSESQLMDCAKILVNMHTSAKGHKLQTVYKYSAVERYVVALCSPAKSLLAL